MKSLLRVILPTLFCVVSLPVFASNTLTLKLDVPELVSGNSTTLRWNVDPVVTTCNASWTPTAITGIAGSLVVQGDVDTTYVISCVFPDGEKKSAQAIKKVHQLAVTAQPMTNISDISATANVSITSPVGTAKLFGKLWLEHTNSLAILNSGQGGKTYVSNILDIPFTLAYPLSGLTPNTDRHLRFCYEQNYIVNAGTKNCSNVISYKTLATPSSTPVYTVTTLPVSSITSNSAQLSASVVSSVGTTVAIGILNVDYAKDPSQLGTPAAKRLMTGIVGKFPLAQSVPYTLSSLDPDTKYYVRHCFVLSGSTTDTACSSPVTFSTTTDNIALQSSSKLSVVTEPPSAISSTAAYPKVSVVSTSGAGAYFGTLITQYATTESDLVAGLGKSANTQQMTSLPYNNVTYIGGLSGGTKYYTRHCVQNNYSGATVCSNPISFNTLAKYTPQAPATITIASTDASTSIPNAIAIQSMISQSTGTGLYDGKVTTEYSLNSTQLSAGQGSSIAGKILTNLPNTDIYIIPNIVPKTTYYVRTCVENTVTKVVQCGNIVTIVSPAGGSASSSSTPSSSSGGGGGTASGIFVPQNASSTGTSQIVADYYCKQLPKKVIRKNKKTSQAVYIQQFLNHYFVATKIPNVRTLKPVKKLNPLTSKALKRYQAIVGIRSTGYWDKTTIKTARAYLGCR